MHAVWGLKKNTNTNKIVFYSIPCHYENIKDKCKPDVVNSLMRIFLDGVDGS